ncbi:MAG: hypothetical protein AAF481_07860 [Acidobacteriota bacterium]
MVEMEKRYVSPTSEASEIHFLVRHLERIKPGTSFPAIADLVAEKARRIALKGESDPTLYVNVTGKGDPILELIREKWKARQPIAVYFNHGDRRERESLKVTLGKAFLVTRLQALLQSNRIHLPAMQEARTLADDLLDYEVRLVENANQREGAFRVGKRDELVTALGMAVQDDVGGHRSGNMRLR